jgi:hypothetical protein
MNLSYYLTGNERISLPRIRKKDAAIEDFTFLHMGAKGLFDVKGTEDAPLMETSLSIDGKAYSVQDPVWSWECDWVPTFSHVFPASVRLTGTVLAPVEERGFLVRYHVENQDAAPHKVAFGMAGEWAQTVHCVNEEKPVEGTMHCFPSAWNNSLIFDVRCGIPLFSFAPITDQPCTSRFEADGGRIRYEILHEAALAPGQSTDLTFFWGLGFEEVAAATSAKEMLRQGYNYEYNKTLAWLKARAFDCKDSQLTSRYNRNLFFCLFYSTGITLDTEELVLVTSRSPRYYVSAAYWDRDSLLWSFPAVLDADAAFARRMLFYVFGRQRRNFGVHSRFIDGTVLEPGFELDELMAPALALENYVAKTGDRAILSRQEFRDGISEILEKLSQHKNADVDLYETFLQPTDDERKYPYLTYDNVLVWKGLHAVARLYPEYANLADQAERVKDAILKHCVVQMPDGSRCFSWSNDLNGHSDIYDEPPGSLQMLVPLGFCAAEDPVYCATVAKIRSADYAYSFAGMPFGEIGCPHAPHPWLLSVANSLLCGRRERCFALLRNAEMDNGIVCESIDETTGKCTSGEAFATCAGFVCHALRVAVKGEIQDAK